jgi:dTDP-glucose 4,6-dehydratase
MKKIMVTGGNGFIGGHFIQYLLRKYNEIEVMNLDTLNYAGNTPHPMDTRYRFNQMSIGSDAVIDILHDFRPEYIVNLAAQTHVDRSIEIPTPFIETNIIETHKLLETLRKYTGEYRFVHISTDEVYGQLNVGEHPFTEMYPYLPNNPYAASKASADHLVRAYHFTYKLPAIITHSTNNYGPYQHPEKFIPKAIQSVLNNEPIKIYGEGNNIRDWMFVDDNCDGIHRVMLNGREGQRYNIGAEMQLTNNEVARRILLQMGKPSTMVEYVTDRPGHDYRYAMNPMRMKYELNWQASTKFDNGLYRTIEWYTNNQEWVRQCNQR